MTTRNINSASIEAIKYLAAALMVIDHWNKYLNDGHSVLAFTCGRLVFPLFALAFASQIANKGADTLLRTCKRLAVTAALTSPIYIALGHVVSGWWPLNVLATFAVATASIMLIQSPKALHRGLAVTLFLAAGAAVEFLWFGLAVIVSAWWYFTRPSMTRLACLVLSVAGLFFGSASPAALLALPLFWMLTRFWPRWRVPRVPHFFYAFYPLHLGFIWMLK